jgi:YVTN family beta-propeller protein
LDAGNHLRFAPSPDGLQIALLSTTGLGFINADGSNHRPDVFPYAEVSLGGQAFPTGVWTVDTQDFLLATYLEKSLETDTGLTIWRVPLDGAPEQLTGPVTGSHQDSVTFSPDGRSIAYYRGDSLVQVTHDGWFVTQLNPEAGPLAVPRSAYLFWKNLHWSPAGVPYAIHEGSLDQLCPDATQDSEVCGEVLDMGEQIAEIYWIDETRFLFVTREPYDLYFGKLDGTRNLIAEGTERFAAGILPCQNDSEFTEGGEGLADMSIAPDTLFAKTWRLRNTGTCPWGPTYRLAFLAGERMSGPHSIPLRETVPAGGEIELSVDLIAPADPGTYQGEWQLIDPNGAAFGIRPVVDIAVPSFTVKEIAPEQIMAEIPAEAGQIALGEGALWSLSGDGVSRIDLDTNQVVANIPVGEFPIALTTGFGAVWVAENGAVNRIDPLTNAVSLTIPIADSSGLNGIAAGAGSVWASSAEQGLVYRIDPNTNQVIATIPVEPSPQQIAVTEDAVWVTSVIDPFVTKIDPITNQVSATIPVDCGTRNLAVEVTVVWVPCASSPAVFRIDPVTNQVLSRIAVRDRPRHIASDSNAVWVTSTTGNTLTQIDPATNQVSAIYPFSESLIDVIATQDELIVTSESSIWRITP